MRLIPLFQGHLTRVCGEYKNASFHGGSNDTIVAMSDLGGQRYSVLSQQHPYHPAHYHMSLFTLNSTCGARRVINPLPNCGMPFWPYTSFNAKFSKSDEGKVLLKIQYSSSFISCLF
jgi:hypothetical protein